jgi:DNA-binding MarR family transcriptional regulator
MKRGTKISRWLNQVKADRRLCASDLAVAIQLSERTNADEFARSGTLLTWPSVATQAKETGMDKRTVQRATRRLQERGHIAVDPGGGRRRTNRITLIVKTAASLQSETPAAVPPFSHENPGSRDRVSDQKTPAAVAENPGSGVAKPRQRCHPNFYKNSFITSTTTADTEASTPRQRADALGALGEALSRLIPDTYEYWFGDGKVEIVSQTDNTITLAVSKVAAWKLQNDYGDLIARCAGVERVKLVVRKAGPAGCHSSRRPKP